MKRSAQANAPRSDMGARFECDPNTGVLAKRVDDWNSGALTRTYSYDAKGRVRRVRAVDVLPARTTDESDLTGWTQYDFAYDEECKRDPEW